MPSQTTDTETTMHMDAIHGCTMSTEDVRPARLYECRRNERTSPGLSAFSNPATGLRFLSGEVCAD
jgi:hypothetical protein